MATRAENLWFQTPELEIAFSREDGGLRALRRIGGPDLIGHGAGRPSVDVRIGDGPWMAERSFVRYLGHSERRAGAVHELEIVIGIGPLKLFDRLRVSGGEIVRTLELRNVGEDPVRVRGARMALPWARVGALDVCRFEAPGASVRPRVMMSVAAEQRAGVLPRRFFAPGLRDSRAIEAAPHFSPGLMALRSLETDDALLCWYYGGAEPAFAILEGNDAAATLAHEVPIAGLLPSERSLTIGAQHICVAREPWPELLDSFRRRWAEAYGAAAQPAPAWLADAAFYELHPAQLGGLRGMIDHLPDLADMGVSALCLLPVWSYGDGRARLWDGNWHAADPYALRDLDLIDPAIGTLADLAELAEQAHQRGMRVLVDLPLLGCAPDARYIYERPDWFCRDEVGRLTQVPDRPGIVAFDWASAGLREHLAERIVALVRAAGLDGVRAVAPRAPLACWGGESAAHASAGHSGYLAMLAALRAQLRGAGADLALIGDLAGPIGEMLLDATIDELAHHMLFHTVMGRMTPAELAEWLDDHRAVLPRTGVRISFTESHRTRLINPLANGLRGSRISRMLLAGVVLCGYAPSIWSGQERNEAHTLQRLLAVRQAHPALRHGALQLGALPCTSPLVLSVLRSAEGAHVIGLLHVGPQRQTVTMSVPVDQLGLGEGHYQIHDLLRDRWWDEAGRSSWRRDELLALTVTLEPFSAYFLVLEAAPASHDA